MDNVAVDAGCLLRLLELNLHILSQILIARVAIDLSVDKSVEEYVIALEAGQEIDERVLNPLEFQYLVISHSLLKLSLRVHNLDVDTLEVLKIPYRGREHQAQGKFKGVGHRNPFADGIDHKVVEHVGLVVADGHADIVADDNTERDCGEVNTAVISADWDTDDNQLPTIVLLVTARPLIIILNIRDERLGDFETRD